jgi:hypothetical protein
MNYLVAAIHKLKPNAQFSFTQDDYSTIKWVELEGTAPTQAQVDKVIAEIKAEETNKADTDAAAKAALLDRLGITADEAKLLLS